MLLAAPQTPVLIGSDFLPAHTDECVPVHNPSTGEVIAQTPLCSEAEIDAAVKAAAAAFQPWAAMPATKRAGVLFRYQAVLEEHFEELAALVTRENGKTREEARGDVRRGIEVVEFACGIAELTKGRVLPQVAEHIDGQTTREPLGVCAGITPFNFPAMVPLWMFPIAIACGNTFILKPSEKTPLTAIRLAELFLEAGLPPGVLNVVHGGRSAVDALLAHRGIAAISFVGSTAVAEHVYATGCRYGKRVQAAGGAKNVMVVLPDADPDATLRAVMGAAFGCAGQRCMAGSILLTVGEAAEWFTPKLLAAMQALRLGDTVADASAQMGPLIDFAARERVSRAIEAGQREGARLLRDGRSGAPGEGFFVGPTLFAEVRPEMRLFQEEIFGPVLSSARPRDLDEALEWTNRAPYGNGAVLFTGSGAAARRFTREVQCGMVGVNVGVPAPMALFAFSGWNRSFFGDLHVQGEEGVQFYTRQKVVLSRWDNAYRRSQGW